MKFFLILLFAPLIMSVNACNSGVENDAVSSNVKSDVLKDTLPIKTIAKINRDTTFYLMRNKDTIEIKIKVPEKINGVLLLLHGWNYSNDDFCNKTTLCNRALDSGFVLIMPNFGKSTYQWENYPQTIKRFLKYPTRKWMTDTLIIHLQNEFNLLENNERNFVYGISTGGRGAALFALENPSIFKAAACLSADFDHAQLVDEPINNAYYGALKKFPARWTGRDNIHNRASEFKSSLYLSHGQLDKVCPVSQTINFDKELKKVNPKLKVVTEIDSTGAHDYQFWESKMSSVFLFFSQF